MAFEQLLLDRDRGVAVVTLNRPEKLNAISVKLRDEINEVFELLQDDEEVRAVILTGAGNAFCSGADVARQKDRISGVKEATTQKAILRPMGYQNLALIKLEKPTIAAVNGVAAGMGVSLALACDIRFASENAYFTLAYVKRGLIPDCGATFLLPRIIGLSRTFEIMYTGDKIDSREAERIGLISRVLPPGLLMEEAMKLAQKIAKGPTLALQLMKRTTLRGLSNTLEEQFFLETYAQKVCQGTEDHKEGVASFFEKRESKFRGR